MPYVDTFRLNLGEKSYIDTLEISCRVVSEVTASVGYDARNQIEKIILNEGIEEIEKDAFKADKNTPINEGEYLIDKLPNSIKKIGEEAFFYASNDYQKPNVLISPEIDLPTDIEQIGEKSYYSYSVDRGAWYRVPFTYARDVIMLPSKMKLWNGYYYSSGSKTEKYYTTLQCDTLYIPSSVEYLRIGINANVAILELDSDQYPYIDVEGLNIQRLYVTRTYYAGFLQEKHWDMDGYKEHVKEILPLIEVENIAVQSSLKSIYVNENIQLQATVFPEDAFDKRLTWSSSNPEIATVDDKGVVTCMKPGKATITATAGNGVSGSCEIEVLQHVNEFHLLEHEIKLTKLGESARLEYVIEPDDASNKTVRWESSSPTVCHVTTNGTITALNYGLAMITATTEDGEYSDYCMVRISKPVTGITLDKDEATLSENESLQLKATVTPDDAENRSVVWSSSDEDVATVNSLGKVTAKSKGDAIITATAEDGSGISADCQITVVRQVREIVFDDTELLMEVGDTRLLVPAIIPADASNRLLLWKSDNNSVVSVDDGLITAIAKGQANVLALATDGSGVSAICAIKVEEKSGIDSAYQEETGVKTENSDIIIYGVPKDSIIEIASVDGTKVFSEQSSVDRIVFTPTSPGIYLVRVNAAVYKIAVR